MEMGSSWNLPAKSPPPPTHPLAPLPPPLPTHNDREASGATPHPTGLVRGSGCTYPRPLHHIYTPNTPTTVHVPVPVDDATLLRALLVPRPSRYANQRDAALVAHLTRVELVNVQHPAVLLEVVEKDLRVMRSRIGWGGGRRLGGWPARGKGGGGSEIPCGQQIGGTRPT